MLAPDVSWSKDEEPSLGKELPDSDMSDYLFLMESRFSPQQWQAVGMVELDPELMQRCHIQEHIKCITWRPSASMIEPPG